MNKWLMRRKLNLLFTALLLFAATGSVWATEGVIWTEPDDTNKAGKTFTAEDGNGNAVLYRVETPGTSVDHSVKGTGSKGTVAIESIVTFSFTGAIAHLWDVIDVPLANTPTAETKWVTYKVVSIEPHAFKDVKTLGVVDTFLFHTSLSGFENVTWPDTLKTEGNIPALIIAGASTEVKTGTSSDFTIPANYLKGVQVPIASITLNTDGTGYTTNVSEWAEITTIGDGAFAGLPNVTITIPAAVTTIGANAFDGTKVAITTLPNVIQDRAFAGADFTVNPVFTNVTSIGEEAFKRATGITVNLSGATRLTAVGAGAFEGVTVTGFFGAGGLFTITTAEPYAISGTDTVDIKATYNGAVQNPTVTFKIGEDTVKGTSVTWAPTELKDAKSYTPTAIALPEFEALKDSFIGLIRYTINPKSLIASDVVFSATGIVYNGEQQKPDDSLTIKTLVKKTDYTVTWGENIAVGVNTATVTITLSNNYTFASGVKDTTLTFTIGSANFDNVTWKNIPNAIIDTTAKSLTALEDTIKGALTGNSAVSLLKGRDYDIAAVATATGDTVTVTITGQGNYTGIKVVKIAVLIDISTAVDWSADSVPAGADEAALKAAIKGVKGNYGLKAGTDYTITFLPAPPATVGTAGKVTADIKGIGNYTGDTTIAITVTRVNIANDPVIWSVKSVSIADTTETKLKEAIIGRHPSIKVLTVEKDYTVVFSSVTDSSVMADITGKGDYTGTMRVRIPVTTDSTGIAANVIWTGGIVYKADTANTAKLSAAVTGILKSDPTKSLTKDVDYTLSFSTVKDDKVAATITGEGRYYGTVTVGITVVDFPVAAGSGSGADEKHPIKVDFQPDFTRPLTAKDFSDNKYYTIDLSHASGLKGIEGGTFGPNVTLKGVTKLVKLKDLILKATGDTALFTITVDETDKFDADAIEDTIKIVNYYAAKRQEPKVIFYKEGVLHTSTVSWKGGQGLKDVGTYKPEVLVWEFSGLNGYFADHISYEIEPYKLTGDLTFTPKTELVYDGKAKTPSEFTLTTTKTHPIVLTANDYDKDSIIWDKNTEAGEKTARVTFTITNPNFVEAGLSDGTGVKPVTATFTINKAEISTAGVRIINKVANKDGSVTLTGSDVVSSFGKFGTDFQFSSTTSGKTTVAATAPKEVKLKLLKKNLKNGENNADYTVSFKVAEKNIGSLSSSVKLSAKEKTYTGFPISPTVTIAGLSEHKDFEVVLYEGADTLSRVEGVKAGKYVIWAEGINTYGEHVSAGQFTINQADVSSKNVVWSTPAFTGDDSPEGLKALEKSITGTLQSESGKYRLKSADYTATLAPSTDGKFVNVTINGNVKGNFKGSHTFRLDPTTGTEAVVAASAGSASYANGILTLTNLDGTTATVVSLNGRTVARFRVSGNEVQKAVSLTPGFYILNAGKTVSKFIVR
ncbi:hypothetical protein Barb4_03061 [Bacteroidales bacterium Barb4]|nr:hypothetical protein Barb4_03061 [Bacteroidales bacterium Barb4]